MLETIQRSAAGAECAAREGRAMDVYHHGYSSLDALAQRMLATVEQRGGVDLDALGDHLEEYLRLLDVLIGELDCGELRDPEDWNARAEADRLRDTSSRLLAQLDLRLSSAGIS